MISIQANEAPPVEAGLWETLFHGVPRAYAVLFFSNNQRLGWWMLLISLLAPDLGLAGLAAVVISALLAWVLQYERGSIRNGYLLFNSLLVGLAIAYLHRSCHFPPAVYGMFFLVGVTGGFFLAAALQASVYLHFGLSAHSMPAVLVCYGLYATATSLFGLPAVAPAPASWMDLSFLPNLAQVICHAFASILFQTKALPGLLMFIGLVMVSPLNATMATVSVTVGALVLHLLGYPLTPAGTSWCAFNFLLCGIALGAGYYIPSTPSLLLVVFASLLCAVLCLALAHILSPVHLSVSALPYNLVAPALVYALRQRRRAGFLVPSPAPGMLPEQAAQKVLLDAKRFPYLGTPALYLPFAGERIVTQAFEGPMTHRGPWRYALDFEVEFEGMKYSGSGENNEDFHCFGTPVLSPCHGVVSAVIAHIHDNVPGGNNPAENWGNYVMIFSDAGYTVMLAHLKKDSVLVYPGQRVYPGQLLGNCGNSGRSPVPHLHLQIQSGPHLGAATRPFCLLHFLDHHCEYHTAGIPAVGEVIRCTRADPQWAEIFSHWLPGTYRYQVRGDNGAESEEVVVLDFDVNGRHRFHSASTGATLLAFLSDGVFYAVDFEGDHRSLLAWFAAGLARVPCIADASLSWCDSVSSLPYHGMASRWVKEVIEPFNGVYWMTYRYGFDFQQDVSVVRATAVDPGKVPAHGACVIECHLQGRRGVVEMQARLGKDRRISATLRDYQP
jgi:hypothetical protein